MSRAFANLDGLMRLSRTDGIDIRPALLRVITDLFVQEPTHTRDELQQYAELSLRLLAVVDAQTRDAVVAKLAAFAGTPAWLLEEIGLQCRTAAANTASADGAATAIATIETLIEQDGTALAFATIESRPGGAPPADVPVSRHIGERFMRAASAERQKLLLHLEQTAKSAQEPSWLRGRKRMVQRLETAALERDPREFARELQQSLGLSSRLAGEIVHDEGGEPLLVVARAVDASAEVLLRILLLLNPAVGESVERVFTLYRLYPQISLAAVAPIMASWREESRARPKARYQPLHAADEASSRAATWDAYRHASESQRERAPARTSSEGPAKRQTTT